MCGLFGVVGNALVKAEEVIMKEMMVASSLRGTHSTGIGVIGREYTGNKDWWGETAKAVGNPFNLMETKRFDNVLNGTGKKIIIGHTRHATKGSITTANAHPFSTGNVLGAHNGTITSGLTNESQYGTDSEALMHMLDTEGVATAIPKLYGAWAITWFDVRNNSFNVLRNEDRPLHYIIDQQGQMFYASEGAMLEWIAERNKINFKDLYYFEPNKMYSYDMSEVKWYDTCEIKEIKGREVTAYSGAPFPGGRVIWPTTIQEGAQGHTATAETSSTAEPKGEVVFLPDRTKEEPSQPKNGTTSSENSTESTREVANIVKKIFQFEKRNNAGQKIGFNNYAITDEHYNATLNKGCLWCQKRITLHSNFLWVNTREVVCEACFQQPDVKEGLSLYNPFFVETLGQSLN